MGHDADMGEKADLRRQIRTARAAHPQAALPVDAITHLPPCRAVAGYLARSDEPSIDALLAAFIARGVAVYLPRVVDDQLAWVAVTDLEGIEPGRFGIREPRHEADIEFPDVDLILLPALAVDRCGVRLGQGGGYYDRALAHVPSPFDGGPYRIAVVSDEGIRDRIPREPHDVLVDAALTPNGITWFTPPNAT